MMVQKLRTTKWVVTKHTVHYGISTTVPSTGEFTGSLNHQEYELFGFKWPISTDCAVHLCCPACCEAIGTILSRGGHSCHCRVLVWRTGGWIDGNKRNHIRLLHHRNVEKILNKYHLTSKTDDFEATSHRFSENVTFPIGSMGPVRIFNYTFGWSSW